ncbi:MAG: hypothetical protein KAJ51_00935 [Thermoplasmata archaeon]|nr:hypothetical protein [Thermoplasmata archaeon]
MQIGRSIPLKVLSLSIISILVVSVLVTSGNSNAQHEFVNEVSINDGEVVNGMIEISGRVDKNVTELRLNIESANHEVIISGLRLSIYNLNWTFKWDTTNVADGDYEISLTAYNNSNQLEQIITVVFVENTKDTATIPGDQALIIAIVLVIFIIIEICVIIGERKLRAIKLNALKLTPKNMMFKLPAFAYLNVILFFSALLIMLSIFIVAITDTLIFTIYMVVIGMAALTGLWALTHRGIASKIVLFGFLITLWIGLIDIAFMGLFTSSHKIPSSIAISSSIIGLGILLTYMIMLSLIWRIKIRAKLPAKIAIVMAIISVSFTILVVIGLILATIEILEWKLVTLEAIIFAGIISISTWIVYRTAISSFEAREESRTPTTKNATFNMVNIESIPIGVLAREYKKNTLGKISYEISSDDEINIGVISVAGDWAKDKELAYILMAEFVTKMHRESYTNSGLVAIRLYRSGEKLAEKLELCKYFGFITVSSGEEKRLGYYHLELSAKPGLFGTVGVGSTTSGKHTKPSKSRLGGPG